MPNWVAADSTPNTYHRVNRVDLVFPGQGNDRIDVQISPNWLSWLPDQICLIGFEAMQCISVLVRVKADRANPQFMGATKHANRNFASVGDESSLCLDAEKSVPTAEQAQSRQSGRSS